MGDERKLVLCIDDDSFTLTSVNDALSDHYRVMLAMDPETGLNIALKHQPDLIILDINMPNISGIELAQMLRRVESSRDTPMIFLSGYDSPMELKQADAVGAKAFLVKPCALQEVTDTVNSILRK
ncbi:MAG TPA: response regulator [Marinobacterium sp.]|nr:response regulator [Marinobacterium sp.]